MRSGRLSTAAFSFKMFNQPAARPLVALLFIQFVSFALAQNETQSKNRGENRGPCPAPRILWLAGEGCGDRSQKVIATLAAFMRPHHVA